MFNRSMTAVVILLSYSFSALASTDPVANSKKSKIDNGDPVVTTQGPAAIPMEETGKHLETGKRTREEPVSRGQDWNQDKQIIDFFNFAKNGDKAAFQALQKEAEKGVKLANYYMACLYFESNNLVTTDLRCALNYLSDKSFDSSASGQLLKGKILFQQKQYAQAFACFISSNTLFNTAQKKDQFEACYYIAKLYEKGLGVSIDMTQACAWYSKAAEQNHADSAFKLAMIYFNKKNPSVSDLEKSYALMSKAEQLYKGKPNFSAQANSKVAEIAFKLGNAYLLEAHNKNDHRSRFFVLESEKGLDKLKEAIDRGYEADKQDWLVKCRFFLEKNNHFLQDPEHHVQHNVLKIKWLLIAFDHGCPISKVQLQYLIDNRADKWPLNVQIDLFEKLASRGFERVNEKIPKLYYEEGKFYLTTNETEKARASFLKAAERGDGPAREMLGDLDRNSGNFVGAENYYQKAVEVNQLEAKTKLADVRCQLAIKAISLPNPDYASARAYLLRACEAGNEQTIKSIVSLCRQNLMLITDDLLNVLKATNLPDVQGERGIIADLLLLQAESCTNDPDKAIELAQKAASQSKLAVDVDINRFLQITYMKQGYRFSNSGIDIDQLNCAVIAFSKADALGHKDARFEKIKVEVRVLEKKNSPQSLEELNQKYFELGQLYFARNQFSEAQELLILAANNSHPKAQALLADYYSTGVGGFIRKDQLKAFRLRLLCGSDKAFSLGEEVFVYNPKEPVTNRMTGTLKPWDQISERQRSVLNALKAYGEKLVVCNDLSTLCFPYFQNGVKDVQRYIKKTLELVDLLQTEAIFGSVFSLTNKANAIVQDEKKSSQKMVHQFVSRAGKKYLTVGARNVEKAIEVQKLFEAGKGEIYNPDAQRSITEYLSCYFVEQACKKFSIPCFTSTNAYLPAYYPIISGDQVREYMTMVTTAYKDAGVLLKHFEGAAIRSVFDKFNQPVDDATWSAIMAHGLKLWKQERETLLLESENDSAIMTLLYQTEACVQELMSSMVGSRNYAITQLPENNLIAESVGVTQQMKKSIDNVLE